MIKAKNIICFGSENWNYPGFQQTIMRYLSSDNRIIYVNSLGTRKIKIELSQFKIYLNKIKRILKKNSNHQNNCLVCSPKIIPLVYNDHITHLNKKLFKLQFRKLLSIHNFEPYILWIGTPTAAIFLDLFDPELMVYHAVDRYSKFSFVDSAKIGIYEKQVAKKADVIICTADAIRDDLIAHNNATYTVSHPVDFKHFYSALTSEYIPEDIKNIPEPIVGYFGGLSERVNLHLLKKVAVQYPNVNLVLIGKQLTDLYSISQLPNVFMLGYKDYNILPNYLKRFSVCLIPYHVNELMEGVDPIKLREYLCLGKPIVSVNLPEVKKLEKFLYIGKNEIDFVDKLGVALKENNSYLVMKRINAARKCDWSFKIQEICNIIDKIVGRSISLKGVTQ